TTIQERTQVNFIVIRSAITHMNPLHIRWRRTDLINEFPPRDGLAMRITTFRILGNFLFAFLLAMKENLSCHAVDGFRSGIAHQSGVQEEAPPCSFSDRSQPGHVA